MVYDLGGGTFDVSLIEIGEGLIEVLATAGDNHLGRDDFDECLTNYIVEEYRKKEKINLAKDPVAFHRVREAAEEAEKNALFPDDRKYQSSFYYNYPRGAEASGHGCFPRGI